MNNPTASNPVAAGYGSPSRWIGLGRVGLMSRGSSRNNCCDGRSAAAGKE